MYHRAAPSEQATTRLGLRQTAAIATPMAGAGGCLRWPVVAREGCHPVPNWQCDAMSIPDSRDKTDVRQILFVTYLISVALEWIFL